MIDFGQDGWYGVISDGIDFENMGIVAQAVVDLLHEQGIDRPLLAVGYDTRFLSREYAWHIQRVLTGNGVRVLFHKCSVSTSILSYSTKKYNCNLGIMVTGGGRPARYSGLTFRSSEGMPVSRKWMDELFQFLYRKYPRWTEENRNLLEVIDLTRDYAQLLEQYIDFDLIRSKNISLIYDAFYGSVGNFLTSFLKEKGIDCVGIRTKPNPGFNGGIPQPVDKNMSVLSRMISKKHETAGFFFNGDGSRIGVVGGDGAVLDFCRFSSMIFDEWTYKKGISDIVFTGPTTPGMVEALVACCGGECKKWSKDQDHLQGNEKWIRWENFSMAFGIALPDFDGVLQSLILLEGLCRRDLDLRGWMKSIENMVNVGCIMERYIAVGSGLWDKRKRWVLDGSTPLSVAQTIDYIEEEDNYAKLHLSDGSWIMLEYEKQEEMLRIVVESEIPEKVSALMDDMIEWFRIGAEYDI